MSLTLLIRENGEGRFIVESYESSPKVCITSPELCYLELSYKRDEEVLSSSKIYMSFFDVKHFYEHHTVGKGMLTKITETPPVNVNVGSGYEYIPMLQAKSKPNKDYIMFVHGWRMTYEERVSFAETAFKRLYWSGYQGEYGLFSWPTGWFEKPAHVYNELELLTYLWGNEQNYGDSEATARLVGPKLANFLAKLKLSNKVHIFAHSMGNVVVSEALRNAKGQQLVEHYVASQAATVGSAYNPLQPWIGHIKPGGSVPVDPEEAWRSFNSNSIPDNDFDMPPNYYSYDIPDIHGPTVPSLEIAVAEIEKWGDSYYSAINAGAGDIINFHNVKDEALRGWEFNQLTKPDLKGGPSWMYHFRTYCGGTPFCDPFPEFGEDRVKDEYTKGGTKLSWKLAAPLGEDSADILGHIIPARTHALGQNATLGDKSVISDEEDLNGVRHNYKNSNQGHSAQFYNSYAVRGVYWKRLMKAFGLDSLNSEEDE